MRNVEDNRFAMFEARCQVCDGKGKSPHGANRLLCDGFKWEMICWECAKKKYYFPNAHYCTKCGEVVHRNHTQTAPLVGRWHKSPCLGVVW